MDLNMDREVFFEWLDTLIDKGNSDWEVIEDFADGNIWIRFTNIQEKHYETRISHSIQQAS
jgi:hypothetical protein